MICGYDPESENHYIRLDQQVIKNRNEGFRKAMAKGLDHDPRVAAFVKRLHPVLAGCLPPPNLWYTEVTRNEDGSEHSMARLITPSVLYEESPVRTWFIDFARAVERMSENACRSFVPVGLRPYFDRSLSGERLRWPVVARKKSQRRRKDRRRGDPSR